MRGSSRRGGRGPPEAEPEAQLRSGGRERAPSDEMPDDLTPGTARSTRMATPSNRCPLYAGRPRDDASCHYHHPAAEKHASFSAGEAAHWGLGKRPAGVPGAYVTAHRTGGRYWHAEAPAGAPRATRHPYRSRLDAPAAFADPPVVERRHESGAFKRKRAEPQTTEGLESPQAAEAYYTHPADPAQEYRPAFPNLYSSHPAPPPEDLQLLHQPPPSNPLPYFHRGVAANEAMPPNPYQMSQFLDSPYGSSDMAPVSFAGLPLPPSDPRPLHPSHGTAFPLAELMRLEAQPHAPSEAPAVPNWLSGPSSQATLEIARAQEYMEIERRQRHRFDDGVVEALLHEEFALRDEEAAAQESRAQHRASYRSGYRRPRLPHYMLTPESTQRHAAANARAHLRQRGQGLGSSPEDLDPRDSARGLSDLLHPRYPPLVLQRELSFMSHQMQAFQQMRAGRLPAHLLLSDRDFDEDDYETLLALDDTIENRKGAGKELIDSLPTEVFRAQADALTEGQSADGPYDCPGRCTVCLEEPAAGDIMRVLPCSHKFHRDCIDKWLAVKASCPICLHDLKADSASTVDAAAGNELE